MQMRNDIKRILVIFLLGYGAQSTKNLLLSETMAKDKKGESYQVLFFPTGIVEFI